MQELYASAIPQGTYIVQDLYNLSQHTNGRERKGTERIELARGLATDAVGSTIQEDKLSKRGVCLKETGRM